MQICKYAKRIGQAIMKSNATDRPTAETSREWESRETAVRPEDWGRSGCNVAPGVYSVYSWPNRD